MVGRLELGHLPMTFLLEVLMAEGRTEHVPLNLPCLIWRGDLPSWEITGPWEVLWMKGLMLYIESH